MFGLGNRFRKFEKAFYKRYGREGVDCPWLSPLLKLKGEELQKAEELLLSELTGKKRYWAIIGLGAIRSKRASPLLKNLIAECQGIVLVAIGRSLWKIEQYSKASELFVQVYQDTASSSYDRMDAIIELKAFNRQHENVLYAALEDTDALVRSHAVEAILYNVLPAKEIDTIAIDIMSEEQEKKDAALTRIKSSLS